MSFLKHLLPAWKSGIEDKSTVNGAILNAIHEELRTTEKDTIDSKVVLSLDKTTGKWLDHFGNIFGVFREDKETDAMYRDRIVEYVLLKRGTIPALMDAIRAFLQDNESHIHIYEPFNNIFILNQSKLNSDDKLLGTYHNYAVIDVYLTEDFPLTLVDVINDFKPAGVVFHLTRVPKMYNPGTEPTVTTRFTGGVSGALQLHDKRDSAYLFLENSGIIGYKRVQYFTMARPLRQSEDIDNPPYPIVMYGNSPWVLVPRDKAEAEGARWVYARVDVKPEDLPNTRYTHVGIRIDARPRAGIHKPLYLPDEMQATGTQLLRENRALQGRDERTTIIEQFMIEVNP